MSIATLLSQHHKVYAVDIVPATILQILILMIKCYFQEQQERFVTGYTRIVSMIGMWF